MPGVGEDELFQASDGFSRGWSVTTPHVVVPQIPVDARTGGEGHSRDLQSRKLAAGSAGTGEVRRDPSPLAGAATEKKAFSALLGTQDTVRAEGWVSCGAHRRQRASLPIRSPGPSSRLPIPPWGNCQAPTRLLRTRAWGAPSSPASPAQFPLTLHSLVRSPTCSVKVW